MDKFLKKLQELRSINLDFMVHAMLDGDRSRLDFTKGYEHALINVELLLNLYNPENSKND